MPINSTSFALHALLCATLFASGCGDSGSSAGATGTGGKGPRAGSSASGMSTGGKTASSSTGTGGKTASSASGGTMRAKIDGMMWAATASSVRSKLNSKVPGGYELDGADAAGKSVKLELYFVGTAGDYAFGVDASVIGARGSYADGTMAFLTPSNGNAGTLTVTALDAAHIAGTFAFDVVPTPGSPAKGTHALTEGEFDVPLKAAAARIAANAGRSFSADFNGTRFNAATVVVNKLAGGVTFNALNDDYNVGFIFNDVAAPGSYELSTTPSRTVVVVMGTRGDPKTQCCWGTITGDKGSLTLTTLSADRLTGSFEFTLGAQTNMGGATGPLAATKGRFDIGLAEP